MVLLRQRKMESFDIKAEGYFRKKLDLVATRKVFKKR